MHQLHWWRSGSGSRVLREAAHCSSDEDGSKYLWPVMCILQLIMLDSSTEDWNERIWNGLAAAFMARNKLWNSIQCFKENENFPGKNNLQKLPNGSFFLDMDKSCQFYWLTGGSVLLSVHTVNVPLVICHLLLLHGEFSLNRPGRPCFLTGRFYRCRLTASPSVPDQYAPLPWAAVWVNVLNGEWYIGL